MPRPAAASAATSSHSVRRLSHGPAVRARSRSYSQRSHVVRGRTSRARRASRRRHDRGPRFHSCHGGASPGGRCTGRGQQLGDGAVLGEVGGGAAQRELVDQLVAARRTRTGARPGRRALRGTPRSAPDRHAPRSSTVTGTCGVARSGTRAMPRSSRVAVRDGVVPGRAARRPGADLNLVVQLDERRRWARPSRPPAGPPGRRARRPSTSGRSGIHGLQRVGTTQASAAKAGLCWYSQGRQDDVAVVPAGRLEQLPAGPASTVKDGPARLTSYQRVRRPTVLPMVV